MTKQLRLDSLLQENIDWRGLEEKYKILEELGLQQGEREPED